MHGFNPSWLGVLIIGSALCACEEDDVSVVGERPALAPAPSSAAASLVDAGNSPAMDAGTTASSDGTTAPGDGGALASGDTTPLRPLPDLVLDKAYLLETAAQDFVEVDDSCLFSELCVTGLGTRRVVRFGTRTGNIGTADLVVGKPDRDNPLWEYDTCAEAYHLEGYARYDLLAEPSGEAVLLGAKNGFCMRDSEVYDQSLVKKDCQQYACEDQGISIGCADNYVAGLECQWVDITGVRDGDYQIRVQINADSKLEELDYSNNTGFISIRILDGDVIVLR
jgi:hypothetical protein